MSDFRTIRLAIFFRTATVCAGQHHRERSVVRHGRHTPVPGGHSRRSVDVYYSGIPTPSTASVRFNFSKVDDGSDREKKKNHGRSVTQRRFSCGVYAFTNNTRPSINYVKTKIFRMKSNCGLRVNGTGRTDMRYHRFDIIATPPIGPEGTANTARQRPYVYV